MAADLPARSPTVVFREMDEGGVLFCSRTEVYFGLNSVGVAIWTRLPGGNENGRDGLTGLLDALEEAYPEVSRETLAADVREFLDALHESELVTYADAEST